VQKGIVSRIVFSLLDNLIWLLVLVALIAFSLLSEKFFTPFNLLSIIPRVAAIGLLVIGQSFTMITANFDLSSESALGLTAMVAGLLIASPEFGGLGLMLPPWLAIIVMLLVGLLIGFANGFMITQLRMNNLIVTIAMLILLRGVVYIISPGSSTSFFGPIFNWLGGGTLFKLRFGKEIVNVQVSLAFVILAFIVAHIVTRYTQFGRNMYAVGANREAAEAAGIRSDRVILTVYIISGFCSALAGLLTAGRMDGATPRTGAGWIFQVQAAAIVGGVSLFGGRGNMIGAMGGLLLWGILDTGLNILKASPFAIDMFRGGLLLFAMLVDALKVRYLRRAALREALATTTVGLSDTSLEYL
jgi:ribose/xylose/arabinose/galactoside ABC-type transport system permease subunit